MKTIPASTLEQAMHYNEYRQLIEELRADGKTTGSNHSEAMLNYTDLNRTRMNRLDKTTKLTPESLEALEQLETPMTMLVLTEAWCGDAAQVIPVLQKMTEVCSNLSLGLILRDEHPEIMDAFLTNGGRSIPKIIFITAEDRTVLNTWGPRPAAVQQMVMTNKAAMQEVSDTEVKKGMQQQTAIAVQKWYAKDKTRSIQAEILQAVAQSQEVPAH
ncbi:thioredoxin family protein [Phaeodactylibacter sp.]|uniref:thioredoxin family protein n=1 Tax=Phaeodactylibacter sp. TaxID=1940289 RepID=UPI0025D37D0E|nr:thioredoxin family protein [Phaeodactylibacter sp.]MCI4649895.1 thioredoxin family protein [Phaeodactylibacter sp.]MCI5092311.1 thioredoxin family protein [Phaeodactylibacter sp.]